VIDTYSSVAFAKVYDNKTPVTAADTLNDQVLPFFEEHDIPVLRVLTDRGTEYCGRDDRHPYQIFLGSSSSAIRLLPSQIRTGGFPASGSS
jgi:hypothetical protein